MNMLFEHNIVLVIDDNPDIRDAVTTLIDSAKLYKVISAKNGVEGLAAIKKHRRFFGYGKSDLLCIVLDIMMPEMDGLTMLKKLRKTEIFTPYIPVIMLTGYEDISKVHAVIDQNSGLSCEYIMKDDVDIKLLPTIERIFRYTDAAENMVDEMRDKGLLRINELKKKENK